MKVIHYNDREAVKGYLDDALAIVTELEVPPDLEVPAFEKAVDLLSGKQVFFTQADAQEHVERAMAIPRGQVIQ